MRHTKCNEAAFPSVSVGRDHTIMHNIATRRAPTCSTAGSMVGSTCASTYAYLPSLHATRRAAIYIGAPDVLGRLLAGSHMRCLHRSKTCSRRLLHSRVYLVKVGELGRSYGRFGRLHSGVWDCRLCFLLLASTLASGSSSGSAPGSEHRASMMAHPRRQPRWYCNQCLHRPKRNIPWTSWPWACRFLHDSSSGLLFTSQLSR
jgi:hypothetical protein